jgi:L-alanine-DL-glutamate epimerase-like enolase superfamily enzyme
MRVTNVQVALCSLALERPFRLGTVEVTARDYVLLRVATNQGLMGYGIGYRSGTVLFEALGALAPRLIGRDPVMRAEILQGCEAAMVPGRATIVRALSMIDLALWDITAKAAGLPLYRLLGGLRRSIPAIPVAGFSYQHRAPEHVEEELGRLIDAGHRTIKIMIHGTDTPGNARYVARMARFCEGKVALVLDAHWTWRRLAEAVDACRRIDDLGLRFIEDPFLPQQWRLAAELRTRIKTPIAIGEDVIDPYGFLDLVQTVDVLRVDATASGGIAAAMAACDLAKAFGRPVVPHVFPYVNVHLACAHPSISAVEFIPAEAGTDPIRSLLRGFPSLAHGDFQASEEPGVGIHPDWPAVMAMANAKAEVTG